MPCESPPGSPPRQESRGQNARHAITVQPGTSRDATSHQPNLGVTTNHQHTPARDEKRAPSPAVGSAARRVTSSAGVRVAPPKQVKVARLGRARISPKAGAFSVLQHARNGRLPGLRRGCEERFRITCRKRARADPQPTRSGACRWAPSIQSESAAMRSSVRNAVVRAARTQSCSRWRCSHWRCSSLRSQSTSSNRAAADRATGQRV